MGLGCVAVGNTTLCIVSAIVLFFIFNRFLIRANAVCWRLCHVSKVQVLSAELSACSSRGQQCRCWNLSCLSQVPDTKAQLQNLWQPPVPCTTKCGPRDTSVARLIATNQSLLLQ